MAQHGEGIRNPKKVAASKPEVGTGAREAEVMAILCQSSWPGNAVEGEEEAR
jgi:hypothetical protein